MFVLCPQKRMFSALLLLPLTPKLKTQNPSQQQSERPIISVTRKNRQLSTKVAQNDLTRKMIDFDTFTKIA